MEGEGVGGVEAHPAKPRGVALGGDPGDGVVNLVGRGVAGDTVGLRDLAIDDFQFCPVVEVEDPAALIPAAPTAGSAAGAVTEVPLTEVAGVAGVLSVEDFREGEFGGGDRAV